MKSRLQKGTTTYAQYVWEPVILPSAATSMTIYSLAANPTDATEIYLGSDTGLFRSPNAGITWTKVYSSVWFPIGSFSIAPSESQRIYLRDRYWMRTDDGGTSWTTLDTPAGICELFIAPSDPDRLYARPCSYPPPVLFRSDDGGSSWITPTLSFTHTLNQLTMHPQNEDLLIGVGSLLHLFRSNDGGQTWITSTENSFLGSLVVDPEPPHWLYFANFNDVMRSPDFGLTWQYSGLRLSLSNPILSPFEEDSLLGMHSDEVWRFTASPDTWGFHKWGVPKSVWEFIRAYADDAAIYARTDDGLSRYISRSFPAQNIAFLPLVSQGQSANVFPEIAQLATARANAYRALVSSLPLKLHAAIVTASQNHAEYHALNFQDPSAWEYGPHGEVEGKPGYTGRWPSDRISAAGFPYWGGSEVMHFLGDPIASVDDWMSSVYHRVLVLDPGAHYAGYGNNTAPATKVDVMDFGGGPVEVDSGLWFNERRYPVSYPIDGQMDVPFEWNGAEFPDPLPPNASRPVGYPFTLQGVGGSLQITWSEMRDSDGNVVAVHPNPPDCPVFNCFALISVEPLQPYSTYTVSATGIVSGDEFDRTWTFTTGGDQSPGTNTDGGIPLGEPHFAKP